MTVIGEEHGYDIVKCDTCGEQNHQGGKMQELKELLKIGEGLIIDPAEISAVRIMGNKTLVFRRGDKDPFTITAEEWENAEKYFKIWC